MSKFNLVKTNNIAIRLNLLCTLIDDYNKLIYKYTGDYKGRISKPKIDNIPKKYLSVNEYAESKTEWKNILIFISNSGITDMHDYIETMIKNWNTTISNMNIKLKTPNANMIFSLKLVWLYDKYKKSEQNKDEKTKHLSVKRNDDFYRLTPSKQSNINSLFRLKKINTDLNYHDIVNIFVGEFDKDFIDTIKSLPVDEINENILTKIFIK